MNDYGNDDDYRLIDTRYSLFVTGCRNSLGFRSLPRPAFFLPRRRLFFVRNLGRACRHVVSPTRSVLCVGCSPSARPRQAARITQGGGRRVGEGGEGGGTRSLEAHRRHLACVRRR